MARSIARRSNRALREIARRHEVLRTFFVQRGHEVMQEIAADPPLLLDERDWSGESAGAQDAAMRELAGQECRQPFDLRRAPLERFRLVRLGERRHVLLRTAHHIIHDKWSATIFIDELVKLYEAYHEGHNSPLPELAMQYVDYARWQRRDATAARLQAHADYWRGQLAGAPDRIDLPTDRPAPRTPSFEGAVHRSSIDASLTGALKRTALDSHATFYMCLLASLGLLLGRYAGQNDLLISSPMSDRRRPAFEQLIGVFINLLALRIRLNWRATFRELVLQVRQTTCEAFAHRDVPFEQLRQAFGSRGAAGATPLTQVALAMQTMPIASARTVAGVDISPLPLEQVPAPCDLELYIAEANGALQLSWVYKTALFDRWRIEQMAEHFERIVASAAADPDCRIGRIEMLGASDRQTLAAWNTARSKEQGGQPIMG